MGNRILKITDGNNITELDFESLDFGLGIGDYFYNGNETGGQIGFVWVEEKGVEYISSLSLTVYVGNDEENDLQTLDTYLINKTKDRKLLVTLSKEDYQTFLKWKSMCDMKVFHFWNNL